MNKNISEHALAELADSDIDFSDIPETNSSDWVGAEIGRFFINKFPLKII